MIVETPLSISDSIYLPTSPVELAVSNVSEQGENECKTSGNLDDISFLGDISTANHNDCERLMGLKESNISDLIPPENRHSQFDSQRGLMTAGGSVAPPQDNGFETLGDSGSPTLKDTVAKGAVVSEEPRIPRTHAAMKHKTPLTIDVPSQLGYPFWINWHSNHGGIPGIEQLGTAVTEAWDQPLASQHTRSDLFPMEDKEAGLIKYFFNVLAPWVSLRYPTPS